MMKGLYLYDYIYIHISFYLRYPDKKYFSRHRPGNKGQPDPLCNLMMKMDFNIFKLNLYVIIFVNIYINYLNNK